MAKGVRLLSPGGCLYQSCNRGVRIPFGKAILKKRPLREPAVRTELIVVTGAERGQVFDLVDGQTLRVGRNPDMDVHLSGMGVSRRHCEISREADQVWLRDVGSTNGTAVANITRIIAPQLLQPDDVIRLSDTVLVFRQYGPMTEAQWLAESNPERLLE